MSPQKVEEIEPLFETNHQWRAIQHEPALGLNLRRLVNVKSVTE